jgi:dTDP-4-dehydrorhamnose reductase
VARAANMIGAVMIHISTDYVFDGQKKTPYLETDQANPLSYYGKSKLEGEKAVSRHCRRHYIIRTSWLFGEVNVGRNTNFVEKMLELSRRGDLIRVINDQIGSPTYTGDLAKLIAKIINRSDKVEYGIYNFSGKGEASWYDFAEEIFKIEKRKIKIKAVSTGEFPSNVNRPLYSYLDKKKIEKALGFKVRSWQQMLQDYLEKISSDTGHS